MARTVEVTVALGFLVLGVIVLYQTQDIRVPKAMTRIGPRVIPTIIGYGLVVIGIWYAFSVFRGGAATADADSEDVDPDAATDWLTLAGIAAGLVIYAATIRPLGYVLASVLLFLSAAWSMGSRRVVRDVIVSVVLAIGTYLLFAHGLNVRLPEGVLDGLL